jgi:diadenosine tetraphosphate (Ap4A) HIT family hydrolase
MTTDCCLCAQIAGESSADLLHQLLDDADTYECRAREITMGFVAVPSVGALTACHVLLCPRNHVRSFAALPPDQRAEARVAAPRLERLLRKTWDLPLHLFEHGNARKGSSVACSVEHAHLHFVGSPYEISTELHRELEWVEIDDACLESAVNDQEYLRYRAPDGSWMLAMTRDVPIPSQLMRRIFARVHGTPDTWDWRTNPASSTVGEIWRLLAAA